MDILKKNGNKYLVIDSTNQNREVLEKYTELWGVIKFDKDDNLPLSKPLKLRMLAIIVRPVFEEDGKLYLKIYLNESLHEQCRN